MNDETKPIKLSKRQKQLMALLGQGLGNAQIAEQIGISENTVKVHLWRMYQRIGVNSRTQAIKWWHDQSPETSLPNVMMLKAALTAAIKFIDGKGGRADFDFYREELEKTGVL